MALLSLGRGRVDQDWLDWCADMGADRVADYELFESYYRGEQRTLLRDRAKKYLERSGRSWCENFTDVVCDVVSDRLRLEGFVTSAAVIDEETGGNVDPLADVLADWMVRCRIDGKQQRAHSGVVRLGDYMLIVDWDELAGLPVFSCNHPSGIKVVYSDELPDTVELAAKKWNTTMVGPRGTTMQRLNVYYPDRVEKFVRDGEGEGGWSVWPDESGWRVPWLDASGQPLGVPVFHFRNRPLDDTYGRSRLADVLPFQDELNKAVLDLNELCDNHGLPQRWATGISGTVTFKSSAGNVWQTGNADAKYGQFEVADTAPLLNAIEGLLSRLARKTRTPMHLLTGGTPPSGESLKTAEAGLLAVVADLHTGLGNTWEDAFSFAVRLADAHNQLPVALPDDWRCEAQWQNPETRSVQQDLAAAEAKQRLGVSKATLLRELGYEPDIEQERRRQEQEQAAETLGRALGDSGFGD